MSEHVERKIGDLTVRIDRESCIGSANCVKVAGNLFVIDDEGVAAFAPDAGDVPADKVREGCGICPVDALVLRDADGKQIVP